MALPATSARRPSPPAPARPHLAGGAGGARAHRDAGEVEGHHLGLGRDAGQGDAERIGQAAAPRRRRRGASGATAAMRSGLELVAQRREPANLCKISPRSCRRGAEARDPRHVLGAGAPAALLPAAATAAAASVTPSRTIERADARRTAELVGREAEEIDAERRHIDRDPARAPAPRRNGASAPWRMGDLGRFRDRLDDAGLVVGQHDRDQRRPRDPPPAARPAPRDRRCPRESPE